MKPKSPGVEKDFGKALKTFARLPAKTRTLELLQAQAEKATGRERIALDKMIRDQSN